MKKKFKLDLNEKLLTSNELREILRVKKHWLYERTRRGKIPFIRVGKHLRFRLSDIQKWLQEQQ